MSSASPDILHRQVVSQDHSTGDTLDGINGLMYLGTYLIAAWNPVFHVPARRQVPTPTYIPLTTFFLSTSIKWLQCTCMYAGSRCGGIRVSREALGLEPGLGCQAHRGVDYIRKSLSPCRPSRLRARPFERGHGGAIDMPSSAGT
ncbi:hypothetical protein TgHK011_008270 [Trichoderma gracile]|nr:hypothetical protein TgHK011_008270 [Trichoderma gracile]